MSEPRGLNLRPEKRREPVCPACLNLGFFLAGAEGVRYARCVCPAGDVWWSFGDDGKLVHPDDLALFESYGFVVRSAAKKATETAENVSQVA